MGIKVTSADARKAESRKSAIPPTKINDVAPEQFNPKSEFHYLLRLHVITLVEDCFIQYKGVKRLSECEEEWKKFKKILERKL